MGDLAPSTNFEYVYAICVCASAYNIVFAIRMRVIVSYHRLRMRYAPHRSLRDDGPSAPVARHSTGVIDDGVVIVFSCTWKEQEI